MRYILPEEARKYVLYQVTDILPKRNYSIFKKIRNRVKVIFNIEDNDYKNFVLNTVKSKSLKIDQEYFAYAKKKADKFIKFIPPNIKTILDIGCGIAGVDIILNEYLKFSKIYLLDKTKTEREIYYGFKKSGAFYSSLELAKETFKINGLNTNLIELIDAPNDGNIQIQKGSIDLVISTISWGFHYPISTYLKSVFNLLNDKGILILDLRNGETSNKELRKLLENFNIEIIDSERKYLTIKCTKK